MLLDNQFIGLVYLYIEWRYFAYDRTKIFININSKITSFKICITFI